MLHVGWIGTGVMGLAMAANLQKAGYELSITTRTKAKATPLLDNGAHWCDNAKEVAAKADVIFSIVGFPSEVEEVLLGENGAIQGLKKGAIIVDMSTSSPATVERLAKAAAEKGGYGMDAPVTGGDIGAQKGTLSIFVGGAQEAFATIRPCLEVMGKSITYLGEAGMGQKGKLANQIAAVSNLMGVCESLLFAQEAGLNVEQWMQATIMGSGNSHAMSVMGPRLLQKNYDPGFFVELYLKDLRLCIDECRRMKIHLPNLHVIEQAFSVLETHGYGKMGTQFLVQGLAMLSGKEWKGKQ